MKKLKIKDTKALYVFKVEKALYCDFCETREVDVIELEDSNETQICLPCIIQLHKLGTKLLTPHQKNETPNQQ